MILSTSQSVRIALDDRLLLDGHDVVHQAADLREGSRAEGAAQAVGDGLRIARSA